MPNAPSDAWLSKSACELIDAYRSGAASPPQVIEALFDALRDDSRDVNAFCFLDREGSMRAAEESAARWKKGAPIGPLDGVPVSIKDLMDMRGVATRRGSRLTAGAPAAQADAPCVTLLRQAGAILFGKTATAEFGWVADSDSPYTGVTRNPRAPGRSAGGSSSGAAAHVARGWGPLAVGSDASGSIRIPASYCGLVGIKPSYGAVPNGPRLSAFADLAHNGPIARTVDDCRLALRAMARPHPLDPNSLYGRAQSPLPRRPILGLLTDAGPHTGLDPLVESAMQELAGDLGRQGYEIRRARQDWVALADELWVVWQSRLYESFLDTGAEQRKLLDPRLQTLFERGAAIPAQVLARAHNRLREAVAQLTLLFDDIDLLLTPACPAGAPAVGALCADDHPLRERIRQNWQWLLAAPYSFPFNLSQQPALVMPFTADAQGLPVGLQVVGRKYRDDDVLDFARMLETRGG